MSTCAACGLPILDRYVLNVLDKSWHQECLRCADCHLPLQETCFSREGQLLCKEDFHRRYGPRCGGCDLPLEKDDLVRRARDKVFHVACFICAVCQRRLDTGEQLFVIDGNRFVCQADFPASRPVSTESEVTSEVEEEGEKEDEGEDADGKEDGTAKRRGPRTTIKAKQLETLKNAFATTPKPTRHIREQLAHETGLNMRVIQVWFQNRRSKERRMKQLRFGAFRPSRRSRGGRSDEDPYSPEIAPSYFAPPFYCNMYDRERPFPEGMPLPPPECPPMTQPILSDLDDESAYRLPGLYPPPDMKHALPGW